ncbi:MAG: protease modulator HflC [Burkholderiales bacterium]
MNRSLPIILIVALILLVLASLSLYTVKQTEHALVFQLGEVIDVKTKPGLYAKIPLIQNVRFFDIRIRTMDSGESERFNTLENKPVLVDSFVKWKIDDVKKFYVANRGGDILSAETRLTQTVNNDLRAEFGNRTVHDLVSGERDKVMEIMREKADKDATSIGIKVIDVRLKRVDLPTDVSESVYRRMEAERKRVANELRSTGAGQAEKIKADADRQREVILAEAYRDAQSTKGEGDAKAAGIYAKAFNQNPEFYSFTRSLDAYQKAFKNKSDVMLLDPNSDFFKYLKNAGQAAK